MSKRIIVVAGLALAGFLLVFLALPSLFASKSEEPTRPPDLPEFSAYHIVYFTRAQDENEFMAPAKIQQAVGAEVAGSWSEVIEAHNRDPLDALIIHASAISEVDPRQLRAMYQNGVVLAFFNTYSPTIVEFTNDTSISQDDWMDGTAEPMYGDFYVVVSQLILCRNGDIAQLEGGPLCGAALADGSTGGISTASKSKAAESLNDAADFNLFLHVLLIDIQSTQELLEESQTQ